MGTAFIERALLWIVLLPLLGALINGIAGRRADKSLVTGVAVGSVFGAFLLALVCFGYLLSTGGDAAVQNTVYTWFSITVHGAEVPIHVRFLMDHLSGIMTVMVTGIGALIHVYSVGYMGDDPGYARFMTYLNLFMASMLILVLGSSLPLMFVGWEGVGLCSYLLIGFWYENADYAAAGRKAFVVNRIGDFGVLMGMFLLVWAVVPMGHSPGAVVEAFDFQTINAAAPALGNRTFNLGTLQLDTSIATLAVLFLFLGCAGKSAQIPLYVWLPDAMAGPTPVSALIHAATMVTAGVYLMVRLSPLVVQSPYAMSFIAIVGALTALLAASIALVQNQMKKILAYSTVSQLGFMFAAVGMGAFAGGVFHVFTHAFFKACLFLGAGSVMHAVHAHGDADIRWLGGLKKWLPKTHITFAIATAAIAGLPLLSGFFSKDEILLGAATWGATSPYGAWVGWLVFGMLIVAATMTAFYMFRLYFRTFHGEFKGGHEPHGQHGEDAHAEHAHGEDAHGEDAHGGHHAHEPHESPDSMTVPLIVLAAGAVLVGYLGLPHAFHAPNWWSSWLTPQYEVFVDALHESEAEDPAAQIAEATSAARAEVPVWRVATLQFRSEDPTQNVPQLAHPPSWVPWLAMGLGTLAGLIGLLLAYLIYIRRQGEPAAAMKAKAEGLHRFLMNKWYVDELYGATVVAGSKWLAVFAANFDRVVVDGLLAKVTAALAKASGYLLTRTQTGAVYAYAGMFVVGLAGLLWWFTYPHPDLRRVDEDTPGSITWNAGQGIGHEYRWDWESDGEWDTEWSRESIATHSYEDVQNLFGLTAILAFPEEMEPSPWAALTGRAQRTEIVLEPGGDPVTLPVDGLVPVQADNDVLPTVAYRNVFRVDGRLPSELQPAEPQPQGADAPPTTRIELQLLDDAGGVVWDEEHEVTVAEGGGFSALLGANEPLRADHYRRAMSVRVRVNGAALGEQPPLGEPRTVVLLRINGAMIADNDGLRDGLLALSPGRSVAVGRATLTVGVQVRATVAVRNSFGNQARSSADATLRLGGSAAPTARLGLGEESAR